MKDRHGFLGVKAAAERLEVDPKTLRRWTDKGLIPFFRLPSGHRRFRVEDLDRVLKGGLG